MPGDFRSSGWKGTLTRRIGARRLEFQRSLTTWKMANFRGFAGRAQQNCKKALTESKAVHIWPLTDAALPDFLAPTASVANKNGQPVPRCKSGTNQLSASYYVGWLFDIVGF